MGLRKILRNLFPVYEKKGELFEDLDYYRQFVEGIPTVARVEVSQMNHLNEISRLHASARNQPGLDAWRFAMEELAAFYTSTPMEDYPIQATTFVDEDGMRSVTIKVNYVDRPAEIGPGVIHRPKEGPHIYHQATIREKQPLEVRLYNRFFGKKEKS